MLSSTGAATEGLPEVAASANERNFESGLVKVMLFISHGQDFTFVDVVDFQGFQNLS